MEKTPSRTLACLTIALISAMMLREAESAETPVSASDVFDSYVRHLGGQDAVDNIRTIERSGMIANEYAQSQFAAGPYHTCIRYPDRIAIEIDTGVWQVAQALKKEGAFQCDRGFHTCKPAPTDIEKQLADTARHANKDLLDEAEKWRHAAVSLAEDRKAWRLTLSDGKGRWAEFDRDNGSLRWLGNATRARRFGDWRQVEGVSIPLRLEDYAIENGQPAWRSTVHLSDVRITNQPSTWCTERFGKN